MKDYEGYLKIHEAVKQQTRETFLSHPEIFGDITLKQLEMVVTSIISAISTPFYDFANSRPYVDANVCNDENCDSGKSIPHLKTDMCGR